MKTDARLAESYRVCGEIARREARNFYHAFRLLPADRRRAMCALYAFMRHTDDLADDDRPGVDKPLALIEWRRDLDQALDGRPSSWPGLLALADTVRTAAIPPALLHEVIDGVEMDLSPRRFDEFEELADYCRHVASAVGLCCIHIWGYESDGGRAEALADRCGLALQLTNILRDVREDAENGRVYFPRRDLERFGVEDSDLLAAKTGPALRRLLEEYAVRAYACYDEAAGLVPLVAPVGRPVLLTIIGIYRALLDEIVRRDYDVLSGRASVPTWRKVVVALRSLPSRYRRPLREDAASPRKSDLVS
ncbi:phytoene/squalene synthase family protein [Planctomyces sp. SH-PL62]|uniref:phytoene/squalene synthase family protein n=1 Tax=Planctomyces sp. SH-PL62 TaxID=1636152 RepID=UPI00078BC7E5|nr:phytoene/squalene synthase family protein [Planctomyces sp. SH-PL62]AMV37592.1 All-trans-phytoene synthase [Planctomyces sp. SH-PL62]